MKRNESNNQVEDRYIPLFRRDLLESEGIFYDPASLRKWWQLKKHAEFNLFRKVAGRIYLSLSGWNEMLAANGIVKHK